MGVQVQEGVWEQRMLLHRRLALELYPHTWHGESESNGVDHVAYQPLTPWEHHGKQHHNTQPHHTTTTARRERVT